MTHCALHHRCMEVSPRREPQALYLYSFFFFHLRGSLWLPSAELMSTYSPHNSLQSLLKKCVESVDEMYCTVAAIPSRERRKHPSAGKDVLLPNLE
jgi:hypothetical protein